MIFKGSGVALVTPFNSKNEVNFYELKKLIEFQIASRTKALIILGTTGESPTITQEERTKIIKFCVGQVSGRIPVIVGTGSNSTKTAIMHTKEAENLGADGVLVVTPYYNKTNQNGLVLHYKAIAKSTKLPIIVYNVPSRTGLNIMPETLLKLSKIKNIVGFKDAGGNIQQSTKLLSILPKNFALYSGDDLITYPLMCMGYSGVISVTANAYPTLVSSMCESILDRNFENALRIHNYLYKINSSLFLDVNPIGVKFYLNITGKNVGETRLPLSKLSKENQKNLLEVKHFYEH